MLGVQGLSVLTHQQEGVSWQAMAQAAVSNVAFGHSPLPTNPIAAEVFKQGEQVVASTMVGQALSRQKLDASSVAANVFGSMLGGAAGAWVGKEVADWQQKGASVAGSSSSRLSSQPLSHGLSAGPKGSSSGVIHPTTESSPLAHSTTGTPVQENWSGDDWRSDFKEANHDAYFAPAYYEIPRQGSSRESVLMQGVNAVNAVNAFGDAFSNQARKTIHEITRHPVQSVINTVKSLGSTGRMLYDVDNQVLNLIGLPHSISATGQASRIEMGAWHALRSEVSQFETGTAVQRAAMLGSAALFVAESLGAGGAISGVGRLAFSASRLGRVGLFGKTVERLNSIERAIVPKSLNELGAVDPRLANLDYISRGYFGPYDANFIPRNISLANNRIFLRVHGPDNQVSKWMMRFNEIEGLTPLQIKEKFALEFVPTYMSEVDVSAGTRMRLSVAGPQPQWGALGGGIQYELLERIPEHSFRIPVPIYQPMTEPNYFEKPYESWPSVILRR